MKTGTITLFYKLNSFSADETKEECAIIDKNSQDSYNARAMNTFKAFPTVLLTAVFLLSSTFASAGVNGSGGGQAVVCRNANHEILSAEMRDLYEAKAKGLNISNFSNSKSYLEFALAVAKVIDQGGAGIDVTMVGQDQAGKTVVSLVGLYDPLTWLQSEVSSLDKTKVILPPGAALNLIDDANGFIIPSGNCAIEQLANYQDESNQLYVVGDIWNKMADPSRAALLVHEALYQHLRAAGETTSARTRNAVGLGFSNYGFQFLMDGIPQNATVCWSDEKSPDFRFVAYPNKDGTVTLQFLFVDGNVMLSKTTMQIRMDNSPLANIPWVSGDPETRSLGPVNNNERVAYMMYIDSNRNPQAFIGKVGAGIDYSKLKKVNCFHPK